MDILDVFSIFKLYIMNVYYKDLLEVYNQLSKRKKGHKTETFITVDICRYLYLSRTNSLCMYCSGKDWTRVALIQADGRHC